MTKENTKLNDISPDQITTTEEQQLRNSEVNTEHEEECDINFAATLRVLSGKWKLQLLYELVGKTRRFYDLRRSLSGISQKMLTQQLRELEEDGLVYSLFLTVQKCHRMFVITLSRHLFGGKYAAYFIQFLGRQI